MESYSHSKSNQLLAIIIGTFYRIYQNKDIPNLIATIGVFVAGVFRIMPSVNKILTSLQNLKFYKYSVDIIFNEIQNLNNQISPIDKR